MNDKHLDDDIVNLIKFELDKYNPIMSGDENSEENFRVEFHTQKIISIPYNKTIDVFKKQFGENLFKNSYRCYYFVHNLNNKIYETIIFPMNNNDFKNELYSEPMKHYKIISRPFDDSYCVFYLKEYEKEEWEEQLIYDKLKYA